MSVCRTLLSQLADKKTSAAYRQTKKALSVAKGCASSCCPQLIDVLPPLHFLRTFCAFRHGMFSLGVAPLRCSCPNRIQPTIAAIVPSRQLHRYTANHTAASRLLWLRLKFFLFSARCRLFLHLSRLVRCANFCVGPNLPPSSPRLESHTWFRLLWLLWIHVVTRHNKRLLFGRQIGLFYGSSQATFSNSF